MNRVSLAFLGLSLLATTACRGGGSGDDDDTMNPDAPVGGAVHIQDVQNDAMPKGTAVSLSGVVVTAIDSFGSRTGDLWVEEPGGGEFSGVKVFGAPLDVLAQLKPGDIVDITNAEKDEFALTSDMSGRTTTEIKGAGGGMMSIVKTGTGSLPPIATVDAVAISKMPAAQQDAEWEKWEGVLIKVSNVTQFTPATGFGSAMPFPDDAFSFDIDGGARVESTMAKIPTSAVVGFCYSSITGIGDYFFEHLVLPTQDSDYGAQGANCMGTITTTTVANLQNGTATGTVILKGVFVTARSVGANGMSNKNIWVSDSLQGAPLNGVQVFFGNSAIDAGLVPGAKVDISGDVTEFDLGNPPAGDKVTEVQHPVVTNIVPPTASLPTPAVVTAAQVNDITTGEPFEGVLVQIANAKVTNVGMFNQVTLTDNAGGSVILDDDIFANYSGSGTKQVPAMGACFATVTGVMTVQVNDNVRTLNPRSVADLVTGTNCN